MRLSIVTTMYRSAPYIEEFCRRAIAAAEQLTSDIELVIVNDGSPDDSLDRAVEIYRNDPRVRVVDLSRNFGHHKAMMAGLSHARGDLVFLIDCDLEEKPEWLSLFHETLEKSSADVVFGVQQRRKGDLWERMTGSIFYTLFNLMSAQKIPPNLVTARLMTRRYVDALLLHQERELMLAGIWAATGFFQVGVTVSKGFRGESTYSLGKKVSLLVNAITSFSAAPLALSFYVGTAILLAVSSASAWLLTRHLFFGAYVQGWPSLALSVWLIGGLVLFSQGVLGIYVAKVYSEVKRRPNVIVRHVFEYAEERDGEKSKRLRNY